MTISTPGVFQRCRPDCPPRCRRHLWSFTAEVGRDSRGHRRQITKGGFPTQRDAKIARENVVSQFRSGSLVDAPKQTVGHYLEGWLARKIESGALRPTTARSYQAHIDCYLRPHLGDIRLGDLRPAHIELMYSVIRRKGAAGRPLSAATVRRVHATLGSALRDARRRGELALDPSTNVALPAGQRPRVRPWEPSQFGAFLDSIEGHRLSPMFLLAGTAGLRRGELCGLRWSDVDLELGRLIVRQQIVAVGHATHVGPTKTHGGDSRIVDLDTGAISALRIGRARQAAEQLAWGPAYESTGLVFTREDGRGWHPELITKAFPRLAKRAGLVPCRLHDLRHLAASLMLASGAPLALVSKRLGHSSITITADTYQHLFDGVGRDAAERAAALVPRAVRGRS
jgi:integrase